MLKLQFKQFIFSELKFSCTTHQFSIKMAHRMEITEKQKQRMEQAKQDLDMEKHIIDWIDTVLHKRPAIEDEEHYIQFIK